jgi:hypothetical protein
MNLPVWRVDAQREGMPPVQSSIARIWSGVGVVRLFPRFLFMQDHVNLYCTVRYIACFD